MQNPDFDLDPQIFSEFIDEFEESLQQVLPLFIDLEKKPSNLELINAIFRPVHSLKGNAAYFGLLKLKHLAHELETLLDKIRQGKLLVSKSIIDGLLNGIDFLLLMLQGSRTQLKEIETGEDYDQLIEKIKKLQNAQSSDEHNSCKDLTELVLELSQQYKSGVPLNQNLLNLIFNKAEINFRNSQDKNNTKADSNFDTVLFDKLYQLLSSVNNGILPHDETERLGRLLREFRDTLTSNEHKQILFEIIQDYEIISVTAGFDNLLCQGVVERLLLVNPNAKLNKSQPISSKKPENGLSEDSTKQKKTMRVSEETIDRFLEYVGELIVVREMFQYLQKRIFSFSTDSTLNDDFRRATELFNNLSHNLQNSIMAVRRIPLTSILQKLPRIVRDIASSSGKEIELVVHGGEIEIDKSLIEALEAPIIHMIRNAADHGIEMPLIRQQKNKSPQGLINLSVEENSDSIILSIEDNGNGLNLEGIRKKAEELGFIKQGEALSEQKLIDVLFLPGVSTASKITDISGRGVGMDVVLQNIKRVGGKISVVNQPGKGVQFKIQVPKNVGTQIINGFLIQQQDELFIIPLENVVESFNAQKEDFSTAVGANKFVMRRDQLMPYYSLLELLGDCTYDDASANPTIVAIRNQNRLHAIGVDKILGLQEVVLKNIQGLEQSKPIFAGAALTGNGRIAMVLDFEKALSRV